MIETFSIYKIREKNVEVVEDFVAREVPFTIGIDGKELVTLLCSPSDLEDLTIGFLFTAGLIRKAKDVKKIIIDSQRWAADAELVMPLDAGDLVFKRLYTSGCGRGTLFYNTSDIIHRSKNTSDFKIEPDRISSLMSDFQKRPLCYLKTGGTHSAALADEKSILIFREDIGRHSAIDKVIGAMLKTEGGFQNKILLTSGRISSEVLLKAQKCEIPIVVSKSAPTNQGVKFAQDMNITLIGFARGLRMNAYSGFTRILL